MNQKKKNPTSNKEHLDTSQKETVGVATMPRTEIQGKEVKTGVVKFEFGEGPLC